MNHYIISYDISSHKLRSRVSKVLLRQGCMRVQKSVFMAPNYSNEELAKLKKALEKSISDPQSGQMASDSVICFPIQKQDVKEMVWQGKTDELQRIVGEILHLLI